MDFILPLIVGLAIGAGVLFLVTRLVSKPPLPTFEPTPQTDIAGQVNHVMQSALADALAALTEQSRRDREESIKLAADRVAEASGSVLSSSQARGQWGERMAEDMLRAAGFVEGINYEKQDTISGGGRPDYTFLMPPDRVLYMDVKFPLDSYAKYVAATEATSREQLKREFMTAVRARVTELQKRDYVVSTTQHSLD
jgi:DNA recombination protein RmuC